MEAPNSRLDRCIICHDHGKTYPLVMLSCDHKIHQLCLDTNLRSINQHSFEFHCPVDHSVLDPSKEIHLNRRVSLIRNCENFLKSCFSDPLEIFLVHMLFFRILSPEEPLIGMNYLLSVFIALTFGYLIRKNETINNFFISGKNQLLFLLALIFLDRVTIITRSPYVTQSMMWLCLSRASQQNFYFKDSSFNSEDHLYNLFKTGRFPSMNYIEKPETLVLEFNRPEEARIFKKHLVELTGRTPDNDHEEESQEIIEIKKDNLFSFENALKLMRNYKKEIKESSSEIMEDSI